MLSDDACAGDAVADDGADVDAGDQPPALLSTSPSSWKSRLLEISTLSCPRTPSIARCKDHKINKTHKKLTRSSWLNCALGMYLFTSGLVNRYIPNASLGRGQTKVKKNTDFVRAF